MKPHSFDNSLSVRFLPALTSPEELAAGVVVLVDVLRASTTITAALEAGAKAVIPCAEVDEARQKADDISGHREVCVQALVSAAAEMAGRTPTSNYTTQKCGPQPLLGGERGGLPIDGFDLGNSPSEFTPDVVAGRNIVFTTTNGTLALRMCKSARRVVIGSFVNFSAVLEQLTGDEPIHILCAGTRGRITREDVLFAGALVEKLAGPIVDPTGLNDEARIARDVWTSAMGDVRPPDRHANRKLADVLRHCQGGLNLINVGLERDILDAADVDRYDFAPVLDSLHWRIVKPLS
jgi:2-phosphosulfolactate phosphatase